MKLSPALIEKSQETNHSLAPAKSSCQSFFKCVHFFLSGEKEEEVIEKIQFFQPIEHEKYYSRKIYHSLIRGVLMQSCPAGAKNFTNYVFYHVQLTVVP